MFWRNPYRNLITNSEIVEWDIKSGNTSIMREYKLAPESIISKIEQMPKQQRVVAVGKLMRKNPKFSKELERCFDDAVKRFIEQNELSKDYDIISIKRDAVYTCNGYVKSPDVGEHIHFVPKNMYHGYICVDNKEFLFGAQKLDVKGISDVVLPKHKDGILSMFTDVIDMLEHMKFDSVHSYMHEFVDAYKKKELPFDFYRMFDEDSMYSINLGDEPLKFDVITEDMVDNLDIRFNYERLVMPLISLLVA